MASTPAAPASLDVLCMAAADCTCNLKPLRLKRRAPGPDDVVLAMKYCGVCHSDVHIAQGAISAVGGAVSYPIVPGHELAGVVTAVGANVTKFKVRVRPPAACTASVCGGLDALGRRAVRKRAGACALGRRRTAGSTHVGKREGSPPGV